ncbi:putative lipoprotein [Leptospira perolatii]|uniref:Lipoprotein n=1 Tax=Leptospira perolatii TaxID=2023191 RepID=A0A2M9ZN96_9LEPT|nr:putative lipoprotein [Leptospira perolatii]PJZ68887.1 putative lipoprotein [Leptospira perolatii]PJZ73494.1 putative lipoprotein [Leptospira perolatii]
MKFFRKSLALSGIVLATLLLQNCFIIDIITSTSNSISKASDSVESLSTSVKSISGSISSVLSSSSADDDEKKAFKRDVEHLTVVHLNAGLISSEFESDLAALALRNGITDWRSSTETYLGIGRGLKRAGVDADQFEKFAKQFASVRPSVSQVLKEGYYSI